MDQQTTMNSNASSRATAWRAHAYPLKQVIIKLQGTRHSDEKHVINQLETVMRRLHAGERKGCEDDDDFGYTFSVDVEATGDSFLGPPESSEGAGPRRPADSTLAGAASDIRLPLWVRCDRHPVLTLLAFAAVIALALWAGSVSNVVAVGLIVVIPLFSIMAGLDAIRNLHVPASFLRRHRHSGRLRELVERADGPLTWEDLLADDERVRYERYVRESAAAKVAVRSIQLRALTQ